MLRIALLKQIHGLSYRELEFHLQDSAAFRAFVGLGFEQRPSHQALQSNVKRIQPETWESIHRVLIGFARDEGIERGRTIRGDTTVVDAAIHEPTDSSLLWDCVRVATRLMHRMSRRRPATRRERGRPVVIVPPRGLIPPSVIVDRTLIGPSENAPCPSYLRTLRAFRWEAEAMDPCV